MIPSFSTKENRSNRSAVRPIQWFKSPKNPPDELETRWVLRIECLRRNRPNGCCIHRNLVKIHRMFCKSFRRDHHHTPNDDEWKPWFNWPSCLIHLLEISSYSPSNVCPSKMDQWHPFWAQISASQLRDSKHVFQPSILGNYTPYDQENASLFHIIFAMPPCLSCLPASRWAAIKKQYLHFYISLNPLVNDEILISWLTINFYETR